MTHTPAPRHNQPSLDGYDIPAGYSRHAGELVIYAGNPDGAKVGKCKELGAGVMIATSAQIRVNKEWQGMRCALDNGAFRCWQRGYPFMADTFRAQMKACHSNGISLDWIVIPDIVAGGKRSLEFSMEWVRGELRSAPRLALAVQDGMTVRDLKDAGVMARYPNISHVFVGGTEDWKWRTVAEWVGYAHESGRKCHVGRCGTLEHLQAAQRCGVDSVDSTSWARNDSWHIIEGFLNPRQIDMFATDKDTANAHIPGRLSILGCKVNRKGER